MKKYLKGKYSKSIFKNESNGYYVGLFKVLDSNVEEYKNKTITFTGYFHELNLIDTYIFYGDIFNHEKYGEQFKVADYERVKPEEKNSIIEFLTSGLFKGIGEVKAKAIVDVLGKDTLNIILKEPNNLILIPGITKKNIDILHNKLKEYESSYQVILKLNNLGFSSHDSMRIYNKYKEKVESIIEEDLYKIIDDIKEIGFKKIDSIALKNNYKVNDIRRIKAALIYIMYEISNTYGHCYYKEEELVFYLSRIILEEITDINTILKELEKDLKIVIKNERIYLKEMYEAETMIVKRFRLLNSKTYKKINLLKEIEELEKVNNIKYNDLQKEAIIKSIEKDFLVITGGPGTGKTTIINGIIELYKQVNKLSLKTLLEEVVLLAPTGRAAKRMSEKTNLIASTIHRFLKWNKETDKFQINEYNKSKAKFVIVDEASMIDTILMYNLLKGLSANCKIVLVGDHNQLPSVSAGDLLHDLIASEKLEKIELTEIYRQGLNSNIIRLAYDIKNQKISNIFNIDEDLTFIECKSNEIINNISEIAYSYQDYSYKNFQILAPMYKGRCGIDEINKSIRSILNKENLNSYKVRVGEVDLSKNDKVIQLVNMPDDNVYNGDIGLIDTINPNELYINFDDNLVRYTKSTYNSFRLGYAISIHKSQGSEFDIVVIPIVKDYKNMLYQKLIYTAVTRAKKKLFLIGEREALNIAINNIKDDNRRTTIKKYLIDGID